MSSANHEKMIDSDYVTTDEDINEFVKDIC